MLRFFVYVVDPDRAPHLSHRLKAIEPAEGVRRIWRCTSSESLDAYADRDPPGHLLVGMQQFEVRQSHALKIGGAPDSHFQMRDVPFLEFSSQTKQVLPTIEITPSHHYSAGILAGELIEVGKKITLRAGCLDGLPAK